MGMQSTMKALADPTRREILNLLKSGRKAAGEIAEHFTMSAPAVSKHLNILKEAELIRDCRAGKHVYYELNTSVLEEVLLWITELKGEGNCAENLQMENDRHVDPDTAAHCGGADLVEPSAG